MKYLDLTGLGEVWANIKSYISSKIPTKTSQLQNDSNYATTSQLPSKTSQLINDSDFTTNAKLTSKANDSDVVHKTGSETINGVKTFTSEIVNTSPHYRHIFGDYGTFWRQDGVNLYLLLTNSGDPYGDWNNFRPLTVNLATGICDISGNANTATKATQDASGYTLSGVVESGGNYIRYSNGIQVCYQTLISQSRSIICNFGAPFKDTFYCISFCGYDALNCNQYISDKQLTFMTIDTGITDGIHRRIDYIAIGFWK